MRAAGTIRITLLHWFNLITICYLARYIAGQWVLDVIVDLFDTYWIFAVKYQEAWPSVQNPY